MSFSRNLERKDAFHRAVFGQPSFDTLGDGNYYGPMRRLRYTIDSILLGRNGIWTAFSDRRERKLARKHE